MPEEERRVDLVYFIAFDYFMKQTMKIWYSPSDLLHLSYGVLYLIKLWKKKTQAIMKSDLKRYKKLIAV
jgi:hypothetical protein